MKKAMNWFFKPGLLSVVMDGGAGSSGKGKVSSYITEQSDNWTFACNAFAPQAGHWVRLDNGKQYFYQTLNGCAYNVDKYEKLYIGAGGMIELPALFREIEENNVPASKLGISPMTMILEDFDAAFERGQSGFDNSGPGDRAGTMKFGSTSHGVGSAAARRMLRRESVRLARDIPQLKPFICDVREEISDRLDSGQSGLLEIAQGYQLSLLHERFYPHCTSRQVTVAQAMSDMFLPTRYAGPVMVNFRTYPIRINSNKYIGLDGKHLTWSEVESGIKHVILNGDSGGWYQDQHEITWDELTKLSGSPEKLMEITSVTKLPRRIATFSQENVVDALKYNDTGHGMYISLNFMNYVDNAVRGATDSRGLTDKVHNWLADNASQFSDKIKLLGTGMAMSDMIQI